jgi:hypothetical protein
VAKQECFGDWVSLMAHQKAAYQLLTELYTPESIMKHATLRNILKWYLHFDTYVSMLSGSSSFIPRTWIIAQYEYYAAQADKSPHDLVLRYEKCLAKTKVSSYDVFELFALANAGTLSDAEFEERAQRLREALVTFESVEASAGLMDPAALVTDFSDSSPDPDDLIAPLEPGIIFGGKLFPTNGLRVGILGLINVFDARMSAFRGIPNPNAEESWKLAWRVAKVTDAIHHWKGSPKGALLSFRAIFALAAFALPTGDRETTWMRRKFAAIESQG